MGSRTPDTTPVPESDPMYTVSDPKNYYSCECNHNIKIAEGTECKLCKQEEEGDK